MIIVKCFAQIREIAQAEEVKVAYSDGMLIADLKRQLEMKDENWRRAFTMQPLIACNHNIVNAEHRLDDGDEIAFFPPVTGG